jgi:hypothetical protein
VSGPSNYGKGSRPRPFDRKKWYENYNRIFGDKRCKTQDKDDSSRQEQSEIAETTSPDQT